MTGGRHRAPARKGARHRAPRPPVTASHRVPTSSLLLLLVAVASAVALGAANAAPTAPAGSSRPATGSRSSGELTSAARSPAVLAPPGASDRVATLTTGAADPTALPSRSGSGRRIVYSLSRQRVWLVGALGHVQRTYLVSGRRTEPGPRRYHVYSKSLRARSAVSPETMRLMVRFTRGRRSGVPIGFHTIPRNRHGKPAQDLAELGRPLSHGCIRQSRADALALWRFAHIGTRVVVTR